MCLNLFFTRCISVLNGDYPFFLYIAITMKHVLSVALLFFCTAIAAQELTIPVRFKSKTESTPYRYVGSDAFGWQYMLAENTFRKQMGNVHIEYQSLSLGNVYKADIQNPLQIVLFYRQFNTVVLLDNQLNETRRINFSDMPDPLITEAVGLASQNRLWIFDANTQQLGLYDLARAAFRPVTPPFTATITYYQSDYNYFYWIDSTGNCYVSNLFGNIQLLGTIPAYDQVQIVSSKLVLVKKDNTLLLYNMQTGTRTAIDILEKSFTGFHYSPQILSIFTENELNQYEIILPE